MSHGPRSLHRVGLGAALGVLMLADPAFAKPEWHVGLQPALGLDAPGGDLRASFLPSASVDLTFGRERAGDLGWGPAVEVGSRAFSDLRATILGQLVAPVGPLDLVVGAGPQWQSGSPGGAAVAGRLDLGYRAFNHTGAYGTGFGVVAGLDQPLDDHPTTWLVGLHIDAMWASLPFVALASWIRGAPE